MTTTIPTTEAPPPPSLPPEEKARVFAELATAHQSQIRIYVSSLGVSSCSIDDFAQDALVIAYRRFEAFELGTNFTGWVCRIARNLIRDDRAKTNRRYRILNDTVTEVLASKDPADLLADQEDAERNRSALNTCLRKLPERNQQMVELRYQKGLQPMDVAEKLGMRSDAVRQRLARVRENLRRCMTERLLQGSQA